MKLKTDDECSMSVASINSEQWGYVRSAGDIHMSMSISACSVHVTDLPQTFTPVFTTAQHSTAEHNTKK